MPDRTDPSSEGKNLTTSLLPLRKPFEGLWRARRGEYRVRYRINEEGHEVVVLQISDRREAYRY